MSDQPGSGAAKGWTMSGRAFVAAVLLALAAGGALLWWPFGASTGRADPADRAQVALGRSVYAVNCASCHGAKLEG